MTCPVSARLLSLLSCFILFFLAGCGSDDNVTRVPSSPVVNGSGKDGGENPSSCSANCGGSGEPGPTDPGAPQCVQTGTCDRCTEDADCTRYYATPYCDVPSGECVRCVTNAHCTQAGATTCNPSTRQCEGCQPPSCNGKICSTATNACGQKKACGTCGETGACTENGTTCACPPDNQEPNQSASAPKVLPDMTDSPDSSWTGTMSIHSDTDEDWFRFKVSDTGFWDGNPQILVDVDLFSADNPTAGNRGDDRSSYELTVWFKCNNNQTQSTCSGYGTPIPDSELGKGCLHRTDYQLTPYVAMTAQCGDTTDDSGVAYIRVRKAPRYGRCDSYRVRLRVW